MAFSLGDAVLYLDTNMQGLNKGLGDAERMTKQRFGNIQKMMSNVGRGATIAGAAILGGMGLAVNAAADFDQAMTKSTAIMGNLSDETKVKMGELAKELSGKSVFSAVQLADAYYFLASAGLNAEQAMSALPAVLNFATAGNFDLARATELLSDSQKSLGLSSADAAENQKSLVSVSDVLVKAANLANASVEQFSDALTNKAGGALKGASKDIEEGVAVLAAFADQGKKGAEAGTALAIIMRNLREKSLDNADAFTELGVSVYDSNGTMRNMGDIIADIENAMAGASDAEKQFRLSRLGFTGESLDYIQVLMGTSDSIKGYEASLRSAGNTTKLVSDEQLKAISAQLKMVSTSVVNAAIDIGNSLIPALREIIPVVVPIIKAIADFAKNNARLFIGLTAIGGILAVGGPLLMGLAGMMSLLGTVGGVGLIGSLSVLAGILLPGAGILLGLTIMAETLYKMTQSDPSTTISRLVDSLGPLGNWIDKYFDAVYSLMTMGWLKGPGTVDFTGSLSLEETIAKRKLMEDAGDLPTIPGRATGGSVVAGGIYRIHERGMELFHAPQNGEILNNATTNRLLSALGGGGGGNISITVNANTNADPEEIANKINRVMRRYR